MRVPLLGLRLCTICQSLQSITKPCFYRIKNLQVLEQFLLSDQAQKKKGCHDGFGLLIFGRYFIWRCIGDKNKSRQTMRPSN